MSIDLNKAIYVPGQRAAAPEESGPSTEALAGWERLLIGYVLDPANTDTVGNVIAQSDPGDFLIPAHEIVFRAAVEFAGKPDIRTLVIERLIDLNPRALGGLNGDITVYLMDCVEQARGFSEREFGYYAGKVREARIVREGRTLARLLDDAIVSGNIDTAWEAYGQLGSILDGRPSAAPDREHADHQALVRDRLRYRRADDEARELFANEQHAKSWSPPEEFGSLADELAIPEPEVSFRFKGMLGAGHNALLVATRKAGKTTMVNHALRCLADGEPFLGRFETTPVDGRIAVFNYEVGAEQYRKWLRDVGIRNTEKVSLLHLRGKRLPIGDPRVREWIVKWLRARDIKVWVLDPYPRAAVGTVADGNAEMQVGTFLDHLDVIKAESGVEELIMPAHTPKAKVESGDESASGSQRLEGWPDTLWYLTKDEADCRFLRAEGRDVDVAEELLTYEKANRSLRLGGWDRKTVAKNRDVEMLREFVRDNPGCTQNAIETACGWGPSRTKRTADVSGVRKEPGPSRSVLHYLT